MMLGALILMSGLFSAPSDQSDVLWQPQAATVPTDITQAETAYQQHPNELRLAAELLSKYLREARVEQGHYYLNQANEFITKVGANHRQRDWLIAVADTLQYQHDFAQARTILNRVLEQSPRDAQAQLMLARIALTLNETDNAKQHCTDLMGSAALGVVSTCLLEVQGRAGNLQSAYTRLKQLHEQQPMQAQSAIAHWRLQILTEQALLLDDFQAAQRWTAAMPTPLNVVDKKRRLDSYLWDTDTQVPAALMLDCQQTPVDSITIRLAWAEKRNQQGHCWQDYARERMQLRVMRGEKLHSADIAYYFTYVEPDAEQAIYWAQQNIEVAQEPFDYRLLSAAKALQPHQESAP
ncbi:hypothetical protein BFR57_03650 [Idiomarina sp. MD25a]|uniref:tetratricopeptide repeat protein n=1 Tax=Idiomarina sp. MD25a TaxID=1889913 RepID=UPI0008F94675|nr:tetratricopeptide repeat protein [Idiomarina sp. MD25a]OIM99671.1 hypothetical protein BFR57_03650 [Idiomarina sp. MD25a]